MLPSDNQVKKWYLLTWFYYRPESSLKKMLGLCLRLVARDMLRFCGSRNRRCISLFLAPDILLSFLPPASAYTIHLPFIFLLLFFFPPFDPVCASSCLSFC